MDTGLGTATPERRGVLASEWAFLGTSALLFILSVGGTIYFWQESMSGGMPGGWTMPMMWMPDQTWLSAAAAFMGMWVVMMVAMMLPSLVPTLLSYRRSVRRLDKRRLSRLTTLVGAGYFFVWAIFGAVAYLSGVILAAAAMQWSGLARLIPAVTGGVLFLAGGFQLTAWKARQLECCREAPALAQSPSADARSAWQYGLRLGGHCSLCCFGYMMILLATGLMDLGAMVIVAFAITVERLAPRPERTARIAGIVILLAGTLMIVQALSMA